MTSKPWPILTTLLACFIATGCQPPIPFLFKEYQIGKTAETSVGSAMLRWASGTRRQTSRPYQAGDNETISDSRLVFSSLTELGSADGTLKELVYKGTVDDKMQCLYREYDLSTFGAVAKPVFFIDVTYDLRQSKVVGYENFKIRVESADGQKVIFTVLEEPSTMDDRKLGGLTKTSYSNVSKSEDLRTLLANDYRKYEKPVKVRLVFRDGISQVAFIYAEDFNAYAVRFDIFELKYTRIMKNTIQEVVR